MFRVAKRNFPKLHQNWLKGLGFKEIKTSTKGSLAMQSEPNYSIFEVKIFVFREDDNVFVPVAPKVNNIIGFGDETGVQEDDIKSFIVSSNEKDKGVKEVSEHFEKINFAENINLGQEMKREAIQYLERDLPSLLEDESTFNMVKKAMEDVMRKKSLLSSDGCCMLCGSVSLDRSTSKNDTMEVENVFNSDDSYVNEDDNLEAYPTDDEEEFDDDEDEDYEDDNNEDN